MIRPTQMPAVAPDEELESDMKRLSNSKLKITERPRQGFLYVAVLVTTVLVAVIGLTSVSVGRLELRIASQSSDLVLAQALARAGVENGVLKLSSDPAWRTTMSVNTELPVVPISRGGGTITYKFVDADGSLSDDASDAVEVVGIGRVGDVTVVDSVRLYPTGSALTCLESSLCCAGNIQLGLLITLSTNQFVSSNGNINAGLLGSSINGSAQAVGTISGTVSGSKVSGITARQLPGSDVFEYYKDNGTWIDIDSIPSYAITSTVLSPASNPYGTETNAEGIYVIDCEGRNLSITNSRIVGTIVLLNPGSTAHVGNSVRWDPVSPNYPALMVSGSISLVHGTSDLNESSLGVNFNPTGTPYDGDEDADTADTYPSEIRGLVYVSGTFKNTLSGGNPIKGVLVCQASQIWSNCSLHYRSTFLTYPPPGFATGNPMRISPGSWKRQTLSP